MPSTGAALRRHSPHRQSRPTVVEIVASAAAAVGAAAVVVVSVEWARLLARLAPHAADP